MKAKGNPNWLPGVSGNPGGRAKLPPEIMEVRALARTYTAEALEALVGIMRDQKAAPGARASAAEALLDRGWGRPSQDTNVRVETTPGQMTDAELIASIAAAKLLVP